LTPDLLAGFLMHGEPELELEAARALGEVPAAKRVRILLEAARNEKLGEAVRAQAVLGLADQAQSLSGDLLALARAGKPILRDEALRALLHIPLDAARRGALEEVARDHPEAGPLVARVLGRPFVKDRPRPADLDAWLKRLDGPADAAAGRRVFFHPKLGACFRCHRAEGRGQEVGPDLSTVGRSSRRQILESILQPSALIAPHYQAWQLVMDDGKVHTGMLVKTVLDEYTYLDAKGEFFKLNTRNIVDSRPLATSIMPEGLADLLTDQEMRDLLAYLCSRR
jgi:putative heme-binding domain-containing protein